ncbi:high affinity immunoglobulin gamma Fc receptor I-like [Archocentrus centrarchus]|uniref:high affinity immunoglobulin gamma Fc receptor I-like n=1 Tax=Archocentrus centrarchus TaxID=63155 RepID=UPI0011EA1A55|nr:high affinity immunoglobulin gamma Fc receptor I-like [Archocentrus centrarchus]
MVLSAVKLHPSWSQIFTGEKISLRCEIEGGEGKVWKYEWSAPNIISPPTSSEYRISRVSGSHRGAYSCRGSSDYLFTGWSDAFTLTVSVLSAVKLHPSWSQIFSGEKISLRCEIEEGEGKVWKYEWRAPNTNSPPASSEYRISRVSGSHRGAYSCRGSSDYLFTGWSDAFTLTVSGKPRATLTAQRSKVIPAGGSVTLSCSVEGSAGWKFDWFRRDSVSSEAQLMRGNEANRDIRVSQGGLYHCRGRRGDPAFFSEDSNEVTVEETGPIKPTVILQPSWTQIFSGETVTVRCEIQGGTQWTYEWSPAKLNTPPTSNEHRISRAAESDSGGYRCRGRRDYLITWWSDTITLTVSSRKPRATLRPQRSIIPAGGSVTLSCSVEGSAGWKFDWFRRDSVSPEAQLMRGNEANRDIRVSQGGLYHCRGRRGDPAFFSEDSNEVTVEETAILDSDIQR